MHSRLSPETIFLSCIKKTAYFINLIPFHPSVPIFKASALQLWLSPDITPIQRALLLFLWLLWITFEQVRAASSGTICKLQFLTYWFDLKWTAFLGLALFSATARGGNNPLYISNKRKKYRFPLNVFPATTEYTISQLVITVRSEVFSFCPCTLHLLSRRTQPQASISWR